MSAMAEPRIGVEEPHFGRLTPRMAAWREELMETPQSVCVERALLTTETYRLHQDEPMVILRALMVKNVLENMSIFIEPASLICGNQASANRAAPIMPEYAMDWVIDELDEFDKRPGDRFTITEEAKQQLRDIAPFWEHNTLKDRGLALMPPASKLFYDLGIIHPEGNITSGDAHIAVYYERVLTEGLAGYRARTESLLAGLDLTDAAQLKKSFFYRSVLITLDAVVTFAHRYAALAARPGHDRAGRGAPRRAAGDEPDPDQGSRAAGRDVPRGHPGGLADPVVPADRVQRPLPVLRPARPVRLPVLRGRPRGRPHHR